jgi:hypothetical protein
MAILTFGKYRGHRIEDVPSSYLCWLLDNVHDLNSYLRMCIRAELANRFKLPQPPPPPPRPCPRCEKLQSRWRQMYRRLVLLLHPDRGGSHEPMVLINELNELVTCDDF